MEKLRIALSPRLTEGRAPEIHWTWRWLLTTLGYAWSQVSIETECDLAYVVEPTEAPRARIWIQADADAWQAPAQFTLREIARDDGLAFPVFSMPIRTSPIRRGVTGQFLIPHDFLFDIFWFATGQQEHTWVKNKHGFFDLSGTPTLESGVLRQALASRAGAWLEQKLRELGYPPGLPRWAQGKRAAASVGHDVDYPEVIRWLEPIRVLGRQGRRGLASAWEVFSGTRTHWHFANWVEMEKRLQARSAFYFVPIHGSLFQYVTSTPDPFYDVTSARFKQLFRYLADEGFEVGLQASYLAYQSAEAFALEKRRLEQAAQQPVVGNRHHYWHLNPNDPDDTLLMHERVGLKYDTSLIHDRYLGWRRGLLHPFFPFHRAARRELRTLQIPSAWMDDQVFGHQAHNPGDRQTILRALADCVAEHGGCFMIDIHDYVFDDRLFPGWAQTYFSLWEYLLTRGDFWLATPAQIAEHWTNRYMALVRASEGLTQGMV